MNTFIGFHQLKQTGESSNAMSDSTRFEVLITLQIANLADEFGRTRYSKTLLSAKFVISWVRYLRVSLAAKFFICRARIEIEFDSEAEHLERIEVKMRSRGL